MTVYVTQESDRHDYAPAQIYGDIKFLTINELSAIPGSLVNKRIADEIKDGLKTFDPEVDFIVPAGSPIVTGMAMAVIARRHSKIPVLRWSNRDLKYSPIVINL